MEQLINQMQFELAQWESVAKDALSNPELNRDFALGACGVLRKIISQLTLR